MLPEISLFAKTISSGVSIVTNTVSLYKNLMTDPIVINLSKVHSVMVEDIYCSSVKSFFEYLQMGNKEKAVDALMDLSNREGTPIIKYVVGKSLISFGQKEIGEKKIAEAINGNPLILSYCGLPYKMEDQRINNWKNQPCIVDDCFGNRLFRGLGIEINEGIIKVEASTFGGNLAFNCIYEDKSCYGIIDIRSGEIIWKSINEERKKLYFYSPYYMVFESIGYFHIYSALSGEHLCTFSSNVFNLLFVTKEQIEQCNYKDYSLCIDLNGETSTHNIKTLIDSAKILIKPIQTKRHSYWTTDGKGPHPSINGKKVYYAMNVQFELCGKPTKKALIYSILALSSAAFIFHKIKKR